jgi:hypothetical protein
MNMVLSQFRIMKGETLDCYREKIAKIGEELSSMTLDEFEIKHGINTYDYIGVGFGYQLKDNYPKTREEAMGDIATPELDELLRMADEL